MTATIEAAKRIIFSAETSLRELIRDEVSSGQYARVTLLLTWAEQLSKICGGSQCDYQVGPPLMPDPAPESELTAASAKQVRKKVAKASKYPVFVRSGNNLVKLSWSKKSKSEYRHQVTRAVLDEFVKKFAMVQSGAEMVVMESVLPLSLEGSDVPAYQSYTCLAWLREIGAVKQLGRRGYIMASPKEVTKQIELEWVKLKVSRE